MHHLIDTLLETSGNTEDYQEKLNEVIELDKEFRLLEEYYHLAKRYYKSLVKQTRKLEEPTR